MIIAPGLQSGDGMSDYLLATGRQDPRPPQHQLPKSEGGNYSGPMKVTISHEFFVEGVVLIFEGQSTEELSHEQALNWFKERGSKKMDAVNEAINCAVNFGKAVIWIKDPNRDFPRTDPIEPKL